MFLKDELKDYYKNRPRSKEIWDTALNVLPGGISHNIRTFGLPRIGAFPLFIESAHGPYLTDIDNNQYLDCWNGHFAMILGHNPPEVQKTIKNHLSNGWHFGTLTEYQVKLAETIINNNPGIEKVRFCTSGTEATMYATRLARAETKKSYVAKAKLGWHGANDTLYYAVGSLNGGVTPPGLLPPNKARIITFELNTDEIFSIIKQKSDELAAIILEPILGGGGGFRPELEFLKHLREETERHGILLIFDEVITGYRFSNSLFQNELKVIPDLTTMGKIIGGGFPIGAIGGRKDIIEKSSPESGNQVLIGGGTFSGYPLSMIAGLKTLDLLEHSKDEYQRINAAGDEILQEINQFFKDNKLSILGTGYKSIVMLHVLTKFIENPSISEIINNTDVKKEALLHLALFNRNISGLHGLGSLSMAHKENHINEIKQKVKEIAEPVCNSSLT